MTSHTYTTRPVLDESKYAALTWPQFLWMKAKVNVHMPLVVLSEILLSPFVIRSKHKSLKRVIGDTSFRYLTDYLSGEELQSLMGTSVAVYSNWARGHKLPILVEELEDGAKLLWVGPKRTEKMLLYCHGGAYIFPVQEFTISFWRYIQLELEKEGLEIGVAIMSYSLVPVGSFPTPLWQACRALQHLISNENVKPSNMQLVGDSAGGNLVSEVLSTMLHPLFSPPIIPPGTRLRGAYMMSPWVSLTGEGTNDNKLLLSFKENDHCDVISAKSLLSWGSTVLSGVPNLSWDMAYIDPILGPSDWYRGLPEVVERVFVSTGGGECLRDANRVFFREKIEPWHESAEFFELEEGVHNDPFFDFQVAQKPLGERQRLTPKILAWIIKGFQS
jgi:acetyl esterase/lipase